MKLNTIKPAAGSKTVRVRVGRGIGSGMGKTAGRGHKGQRARKGGRARSASRAARMPIQRRLPKRGFNSAMAKFSAEVRLSDLEKAEGNRHRSGCAEERGRGSGAYQAGQADQVRQAHRKLELSGLGVTKGAREAVLAAGGSIAEVAA